MLSRNDEIYAGFNKNRCNGLKGCYKNIKSIDKKGSHRNKKYALCTKNNGIVHVDA